jgi:(p)ppGpp synthase/HD superfamily hydrolase
VSGCTVHFADDAYDTGPIIVQRTCAVAEDDTPDTLAARVFEEECLAYPQAIALMASGRVILKGHRARVAPWHKDLLERARAFMTIAHDNQLRAGGQPYATHPAAVVELLRTHGMSDIDVLAAGYLHDTIEDTGVTEDQLARAFNPRVASIVAELTNPPEVEESSQKKADYLVKHAPKLSREAKWVKLADRAHNVSELSDKEPAKRERYAKATVRLLEALKPWPSESLAREIERGAAPYLK